MKRSLVAIAILILAVAAWQRTKLESRPSAKIASQIKTSSNEPSTGESIGGETSIDSPTATPTDSPVTDVKSETALQIFRTGTVSQVLAILPQIAQNPDSVAQNSASLQASLCRFQNDELGFEIVKYKFALLFGKSNVLRPWTTLCPG